MRIKMHQKFAAVLLLFSMVVGLFSWSPVFDPAFAEGEQGSDITASMLWTVDAASSQDGNTYAPLSTDASTVLHHGDYLSFTYILQKNGEVDIKAEDFVKIPISNAYGNLTEAELKDMERLLNNSAGGSLTGRFDSYTDPQHLILKFMKPYGVSEEPTFKIVSVMQLHMSSYTVNQPFVLTVPLPGQLTSSYPLKVVASSADAPAIAIVGVRDQGPEIVWTIDANKNLEYDNDYLIVRHRLPQELMVADVEVKALDMAFDADRQFIVTEGATLTEHTGGGNPPAGTYTRQIVDGNVVYRIANPKNAQGYRQAFRLVVTTHEDPAHVQAWERDFTYESFAELIASEDAPSHLAQAKAMTTFSVPALIVKRYEPTEPNASYFEINKRTLEWHLTVNPSKLPITGAVLSDEIVTEAPNEAHRMTFALSDMQLFVTDAQGVRSQIPLQSAAAPGATWVEFGPGNHSFKIHFADEHISRHSAELKVTSTLAESDAIFVGPTETFQINNVTTHAIRQTRLYTDVKFHNNASLTFDRLPAGVEVKDSASTKVLYGRYIVKVNYPPVVYDRTIGAWHVYYNLAGLPNTGVTEIIEEVDAATQTLALNPDGSLDLRHFVVRYVEMLRNPDNPEATTVVQQFRIPANQYTVEKISDTKFRLRITHPDGFNRPIIVTFRTQIKPSAYQGGSAPIFKNTVGIGGEDYVFASLGGQNTFFKRLMKANPADPDFRFSDKSVGFRFEVDPRQFPMNNFVAEDVFPDGLVITGAQLKALAAEGVTTGTDKEPAKGGTLVHGVDFKLTALPAHGTEFADVDVATVSDRATFKSFRIVFLKPLDGIKYFMAFRASLDPDKQLTATSYNNRVNYNWDGAAKPVSTYALAKIAFPLYQQNGAMSGTLFTQQKQVQWQIDFNYMARNVFNAEVVGSVSDGQEIDASSFRFYKDTVGADGQLILDGPVTPVDPAAEGIRITVSEDKKSFRIYFYPEGGDKELTAPYRIVYAGKMVGLAKQEYKSESVVHFKDWANTPLQLPLQADAVKHEKYNEYVKKSGVASTDSPKTQWSIVINEAYSDIYQLTLVDSFTPGLEIDETSFRLYDDQGTLVAEGEEFFRDWFAYVAPTGVPSEVREFKLVFREDLANQKKIDRKMEIRYEMTLNQEYLYSNTLSNTVRIDGSSGTVGEQESPVTVEQRYYTISVEETNVDRQMRITKIDEDDGAVIGATFRIERVLPNGSTIRIGQYVTDELGTALVSRLRKDVTYRVVEVQAAPGFWLPIPAYREFSVTDANDVKAGGTPLEIEFTNDFVRSITVVKRDARTGNPMQNVTFELRAEDNTTVLETATTDADGRLRFDVRVGTYWVVEQETAGYYTAAPMRVVVDRSDYVTVNNQQEKKLVYPLTVENEPKRIVRIIKTDENNERLSGVVFTITDPSGAVRSETTDNNGVIEFAAELGTYRFVEASAPTGFVVDSQPFTIEVQLDMNGVKVYEYERTVVNRRVTSPSDPTGTYTETTTVLSSATDPTGTSSTTDPTGTTVAAPTDTTANTSPDTGTTTANGTTVGAITETSNRNTTQQILERTTGEFGIGGGDTVEVSRGPENGTLIITDGGWEYIPLGVPVKDSFVVTVTKTDGSTETITVDVVPDNIPLGSLPTTGQLPEWIFYLGGAMLVLLGILVRKLAGRGSHIA